MSFEIPNCIFGSFDSFPCEREGKSVWHNYLETREGTHTVNRIICLIEFNDSHHKAPNTCRLLIPFETHNAMHTFRIFILFS